MRGNPYPHRYKHGKQKKAITLEQFKPMIDKVDQIDLGKYNPLTVKSFLAVLYWCGLRKTEVHGSKRHRYVCPSCKRHEQPIAKYTEAIPGILKEDIEVKGDMMFIEAVARKHGKREAPLELWLGFPFMDLILEQWKRTPPKQRVWPIAEWDSWNLMKKIDKKKYLHYLRFVRITELCANPKLSVADICSWTGLTPQTINDYMERSGRFIKRTAQAMREQYERAMPIT
ncbi:MAG: hypothetical protein OEY39_02925 [Candidatus Bathyarchaeota archaeon]|nr:hypothetical protein [Candidatus Bathyarchaeota archaeon]MDH5623400.1 hypothetical protein [Candidatus Bathyarchaeota archaeon]MDH5635887.1 hypothetical protein [Candidatus Bathyarchaeota archaeon]MDH5702101.1 hypothetical protein [Candidatus Bathyarchaeota archaeon]